MEYRKIILISESCGYSLVSRFVSQPVGCLYPESYRKRFGIETSYRLNRKLLGWTTSANPAYRFVLMGVGFILLNLWVELCWEFTQVARRGGRFLNAELFRQQRFINFLIHALEQLYGRISNITAPAPPLL